MPVSRAGGIDLKLTVNDLPRVRTQLPRIVEALIRKATFDVLAGAITRVPVDTGTLKNSLHASFDRSLGSFSGIVSSQVEYAPYVELGTRYMGAQPYLRPAFEAVEVGLVAAFRAALGRL